MKVPMSGLVQVNFEAYLRDTILGRRMNLSTPRPEGRALPSTRAQAEGLKVHPEPRLLAPETVSQLPKFQSWTEAEWVVE